TPRHTDRVAYIASGTPTSNPANSASSQPATSPPTPATANTSVVAHAARNCSRHHHTTPAMNSAPKNPTGSPAFSVAVPPPGPLYSHDGPAGHSEHDD